MSEQKGNPVAVTTPKARLYFPRLFKPEAVNEGDEPKYSVVFGFEKGADFTEIKAAVTAAIAKKWGGSPPKGLYKPVQEE